MNELNQDLMFQQVEMSAKLSELCVLSHTTSTSDYVLSRSKDAPQGVVVCVADQQSAGRGRNGKKWVSPAGANVYLSLGYEFPASLLETFSCLSCACGVAICRMLESLGCRPGIKWPNDIFIDGKKLAGMLVETKVSSDSVYAVIGVGVNVSMRDLEAADLPDDLPGQSSVLDIGQPWTDLNIETGQAIDRNYLSAKLIDVLIDSCQQYSETGFSSFKADWQKYDILCGKKVMVDSENQSYEAKVEGFHDDCAIALTADAGKSRLYAADITLKVLQ